MRVPIVVRVTASVEAAIASVEGPALALPAGRGDCKTDAALESVAAAGRGGVAAERALAAVRSWDLINGQ